MAAASRALARPGAAATIADVIAGLCEERDHGLAGSGRAFR
jgi:hypothetical protein